MRVGHDTDEDPQVDPLYDVIREGVGLGGELTSTVRICGRSPRDLLGGKGLGRSSLDLNFHVGKLVGQRSKIGRNKVEGRSSLDLNFHVGRFVGQRSKISEEKKT